MVNTLINKSIFSIFSIVCSVFTFLTIIVGAFYFSDKGFELSDETYYLFFTEHINSNSYLAQNFGMLNKIASLWHPTLINLRIAKFIIQTIAVIVFVSSLLKHLKYHQLVIPLNFKLLVYSCVIISSYVNYDYLPMTMSYNTWTLILNLFGFALIFIELSRVAKVNQFFISLLMGFIVFELFLVKFPNAIILLGIYVFIVFMYNRKYGLLILSGFVSGIICSFLILLHDINHLTQILNNYHAAIFKIKHVGSDSYPLQLRAFFKLCSDLGYLKYLMLITITSFLIYKFNKKKHVLLNYFPIFSNFCFGILFFKGNSQNLYNDFMVGSIFLLNAVIYILVNYNISRKKHLFSQLNILAFILILLPFLLMIGTNNDFYYTTSQTICFSVAGALILIYHNANMDKLFLPTTSVFVCSFILSVCYYGGVKNPYRQNNLLEKKYPIHFHPSIDGVYESYERFVDYTNLNLITNTLSPQNKTIVTFFNYFGLHYISNKNIFPECPLSDGEQYIFADKYVLDRVNFKNGSDLIIVPSTVYENLKFHKMFEEYGINFGVNYKLAYSYTFLSTKEVVYFLRKVY